MLGRGSGRVWWEGGGGGVVLCCVVLCLWWLGGMADSWTREFEEAARLAADIEGRVAEKNDLPPHSSEGIRIASVTRRKLAMLNNKIDRLESLLQSGL